MQLLIPKSLCIPTPGKMGVGFKTKNNKFLIGDY